MGSIVKSHQIEGTVAPGFEPVKKLFEHNMRTLFEKNTQLCVYHKGNKVVDLWAKSQDDNRFTADSIVNVFSSGKSLEAIAIASLVDKGFRFNKYGPFSLKIISQANRNSGYR